MSNSATIERLVVENMKLRRIIESDLWPKIDELKAFLNKRVEEDLKQTENING
jgi:hypothetical protein